MPSNFEFVASLPLFSSLQHDEEQVLKGLCCRKPITQRLQLVSSGAPVDYLGMVLSGRVGEYAPRGCGGAFLLRILSPGDTFGHIDPGANGCAPMSVLALEPGEVLCIANRAIEQIAARNSKFCAALQVERSRRFQRAIQHMQLLTIDGSEERVMAFLSLIAGDFGLKDREGRHIPVALSHQTIADSCGLTRETVSRKFGALAEAGQVHRTELGWVLP
ncbi:MAG: Crp/Fnr family transcriptional regulator [Planctomycetia bacterium]|nr:Crp/Fnr family transcriptional regulator [Planctomycetia bacterium]